MSRPTVDTLFPQSTPFWRGETWGGVITYYAEYMKRTPNCDGFMYRDKGRIFVCHYGGRSDPTLRHPIPKSLEGFALEECARNNVSPEPFRRGMAPVAHAGHIITPFINANGLRKYSIQIIGETKPRGQTLTLESAKSLAEQFEPSTPTKLGGYERLFSTELTPTGEQTVIPGCERNASPTASQLDLFG